MDWSSELRPGERLLWSGSPIKGVRLRSYDVVAIPLSLLWLAFALFWLSSFWAIGAPIVFNIAGLFILLVGLHFVIGRFIFDAMRRERTFYAISNQRALIVADVWGRLIRSHPINADTPVSRSFFRSGEDLAIGDQLPMFSRGGMDWTGAPTGFVFEGVVDGDAVAKAIATVQQEARSRVG